MQFGHAYSLCLPHYLILLNSIGTAAVSVAISARIVRLHANDWCRKRKSRIGVDP